VNFFIADFYCAKARLVIEIDGRIHEDKVEYDLWRQNIIEEMNLTVLRFKNDEVENLEATIATIREYLISITSNFLNGHVLLLLMEQYPSLTVPPNPSLI